MIWKDGTQPGCRQEASLLAASLLLSLSFNSFACFVTKNNHSFILTNTG